LETGAGLSLLRKIFLIILILSFAAGLLPMPARRDVPCPGLIICEGKHFLRIICFRDAPFCRQIPARSAASEACAASYAAPWRTIVLKNEKLAHSEDTS
jgi:hypothetical protein